MKKTLFIWLLVIISFEVHATNISGGNVSGIWTQAGSPYYINGSITVPAASTLEIQPGVKIIFNNTYDFIVDGKIKCIGTLTDSIYFSSASSTINWQGITINGSSSIQDSLELKYCVFGNMNNGISPNYFNYLKLTHCRFYKNILGFQDTYYTTSTYSEISDNLFHNNNNIYFNSNGYRLLSVTSKSKVINNVFINNANGCLRIFSGISSDTAIVQHNIFNQSYGTGGNSANLAGNNVNVKFSDNVFKNNTSTYNYSNPGWGSIYIGCKFTSFERDSFINNFVPTGNGGAIYQQVGNKSIINNCFFKGNSAVRTGVAAYGDIYAEHHTNLEINQTTFENSPKKSIYIDHDSNLKINKCKFSNVSEAVINSPDGNIISVTNSLFANNDGYIILAANYAELTVGNCTFVNNTNSMGGYSKGIYAYNLFKLNIYNSNFWGCASGTCGYDIYINEPLTIASTIAIKNCNIQGGFSNIYVNSTTIGTYTNNLNTTPLFVNPSATSGTITPNNYNYELLTSSPLINKGTPDTTGLKLGHFDLNNFPRIMADTIDIGAYELPHNPIINLTQTQFSYCENSNASITIPVIGADSLIYKWQRGASVLTNTTNVLSFVNISPADTGIYAFIVSNTFGSDTLNFHLTINPLPVVDFTTSQTVFCLANGSTSLTGGTPINGSYFGQGVNNNSFIPSNAGVGNHLITYSYSDNYGCSNSDTVTFHVDLCTGIKQLNANDDGVNIYPNPNNGMFTITSHEILKDIKITTILGEEINCNTNLNSNKHDVSISNLSAGIYFIKINTSTKSYLKRIIVN